MYEILTLKLVTAGVEYFPNEVFPLFRFCPQC